MGGWCPRVHPGHTQTPYSQHKRDLLLLRAKHGRRWRTLDWAEADSQAAAANSKQVVFARVGVKKKGESVLG